MAGIARRAIGTMIVVAMFGIVGSVDSVGATSAFRVRADGWDRRLAPIARKVEELRKLEFKHPVTATFLTPAKFRKRVTSDEEKVTRKERREIEVGESELRALGMVDASFDLFETVNDVSGSSILAYYDPADETIVVRGKKLDPGMRVTLAHELTHALQDQHYDLEKLRNGTKTSGADDAIVALVEGDATRIETEYYFDLSEFDQRAVDKSEGFSTDGTENPANPDLGPTTDSAGIVGALFEAPYAFGPQMVEVILGLGQRRALDRAFERPPTTQLQYLVPTRSVNRAAPTPLRRPKLRAGARRLGSDTPDDFGAMDLYLLLASRLPASVSLQAADAWGNGKELVSRFKGEVCVDLIFVGRDRAGSERLGAALTLWAAAMPAGSVDLSEGGRAVRACDPRGRAEAPENGATDALGFAAIRNVFVTDLVDEGAPGGVAGCIGDAIIVRPEFDALVATVEEEREPTEAEIEGIGSAIERLIEDCA